MSRKDIQSLVIEDMKKRRALGKKRYGKYVYADAEGMDWLQEAYEEALDLAVYLRAEISRRDKAS